VAQVGFRLLHDQHVEENEHLAEVVIGANPPRLRSVKP
jgi:hypothetical protein